MKETNKKDKVLEEVLQDLEKQFGKGAVMCLGDDHHHDVEVTSSGSLTLDVALGVGGYFYIVACSARNNERVFIVIQIDFFKS